MFKQAGCISTLYENIHLDLSKKYQIHLFIDRQTPKNNK